MDTARPMYQWKAIRWAKVELSTVRLDAFSLALPSPSVSHDEATGPWGGILPLVQPIDMEAPNMINGENLPLFS